VTDEELVLLARRGDADAFDQLVARHEAAVYRTVLAALRVPADAEEVAQDAFVRAWRSLDRFRGDASFRTWVSTIAWNCAMSQRRRTFNWWRRTVSIEDASDLATSQPDAQQRLGGRELKAQIAGAIEALSPKLRDALLLAESGEHGYDEIGRMLKIPVGTVKWRVSEARRKIRVHLAARGYVDAR
jgi:RNA polymerase sigma-70 factor (ECF subfamily)